MPSIKIDCLHVGEYKMNCYLVENTDTDEVIIVDPGADGDRIMQKIGFKTPVAVLLTHAHYDHIGAAEMICEEYQIPLYVHRKDEDKLMSPEKNCGKAFGRNITVRTRATLLEGGEHLSLAGIDLVVMHTPGHSAGSCCYLLPDGAGLISGDTLFAHGYGRTDFDDGSFATLKQSLKQLFNLTPKMPLYPGHEEAGIVGRDPAPENG